MDQTKKELLSGLNSRIKEIQGRLAKLQSARLELKMEMVTEALEEHGMSPRDCCVDKPPRFYFGNWECEPSPIGTCVYNQVVDRDHDNCLFCHEPEERA